MSKSEYYESTCVSEKNVPELQGSQEERHCSRDL